MTPEDRERKTSEIAGKAEPDWQGKIHSLLSQCPNYQITTDRSPGAPQLFRVVQDIHIIVAKFNRKNVKFLRMNHQRDREALRELDKKYQDTYSKIESLQKHLLKTEQHPGLPFVNEQLFKWRSAIENKDIYKKALFIKLTDSSSIKTFIELINEHIGYNNLTPKDYTNGLLSLFDKFNLSPLEEFQKEHLARCIKDTHKTTSRNN